ncbi:hypothetical protein Micbo1qcDRAFT_169334, partial [Microdochium bolleyi]
MAVRTRGAQFQRLQSRFSVAVHAVLCTSRSKPRLVAGISDNSAPKNVCGVGRLRASPEHGALVSGRASFVLSRICLACLGRHTVPGELTRESKA